MTLVKKEATVNYEHYMTYEWPIIVTFKYMYIYFAQWLT